MKVLLAVVITAVIFASPAHAGETRESAIDIASIAGLSEIDSSFSGSEARVWRSTALLDTIEGWVVTEDQIRTYAGPASGPIQPVSSVSTPKAAAILQAIASLSSHDGQWLTCGRVKDGWSLVLESTSNGNYFSLGSSTPNLCNEGLPLQLWAIHQALTDATGGAP